MVNKTMMNVLRGSKRYVRYSRDEYFDKEINPYVRQGITQPKRLSPKYISGKRVIIGRLMDPYGDYELTYKHTLAILTSLASIGCDVCIMTISKNVFRDVGILKCFKTTPTICVPIRSERDNVIYDCDNRPTVEDRVELLKQAKEEGFKTICRVSRN